MKHHLGRARLLGIAVVLTVVAAACSTGSNDVRADAVENYAALVHEAYSVSLASAVTMDEAIDAFLAEPTDANLDAAKQAWLEARDDYGVTEVFRFYGGPIDNEDDGPEGLINAWPLDEVYIDYVEGAAEGGIVNDPATYPVIDASVITELNEQGGEANISTGWHAIEFLLWGQDLNDDGPGSRPVTDYTDANNADRRATYLAVASDLLLEHLESLVDAWAPDAENYRAEFVALEADAALELIITGMGELTLGELAGERMTVAYEARSQEDEHSCFSDNTIADYVANIEGIEAVATGDYGSVSGTGILDVIAAEDQEAADALEQAIEASKAAAAAIPAPLDQWLRPGVSDSEPGRVAMLTTIEALEAQSEAITIGADRIGIAVS